MQYCRSDKANSLREGSRAKCGHFTNVMVTQMYELWSGTSVRITVSITIGNKIIFR